MLDTFVGVVMGLRCEFLLCFLGIGRLATRVRCIHWYVLRLDGAHRLMSQVILWN